MSEQDWVSVGQYSDPMSALVVSKRLSDEGVPNRIWTPPRSGGESYVWVPPESADVAKRIISEPAISEAELTALALKDPPPDDFEAPESEQRRTFSEPPASHPLLYLTAVLGIGLLAALLLYVPRIPSREIDRKRSPDGTADAVLMDVPHDAAGVHSYRVCIQRAVEPKTRPFISCSEVAYLGGVSTDNGSQPVALVWTTSSQLEIRYVSATSIHVSQPLFTWGSARYPVRMGSRAILIETVQTGHEDAKTPAEHR